MNRLALIAATGFLMLTLTACGEHGNSKPVAGTSDTTTTTVTTQPDQNTSETKSETPAPQQSTDGHH